MSFCTGLAELLTTMAGSTLHTAMGCIEELRKDELGFVQLQRRQFATSTFTFRLRLCLSRRWSEFEISEEKLFVCMAVNTAVFASFFRVVQVAT